MTMSSLHMAKRVSIVILVTLTAGFLYHLEGVQSGLVVNTENAFLRTDDAKQSILRRHGHAKIQTSRKEAASALIDESDIKANIHSVGLTVESSDGSSGDTGLLKNGDGQTQANDNSPVFSASLEVQGQESVDNPQHSDTFSGSPVLSSEIQINGQGYIANVVDGGSEDVESSQSTQIKVQRQLNVNSEELDETLSSETELDRKWNVGDVIDDGSSTLGAAGERKAPVQHGGRVRRGFDFPHPDDYGQGGNTGPNEDVDSGPASNIFRRDQEIMDAFLAKDFRYRGNTIVISNITNRTTGGEPSNIDIPVFDMSLQKCPDSRNTTFTASRGLIKGLTWDEDDTFTMDSRLETDHFRGPCSWTIDTPSGFYLSVAVRFGWKMNCLASTKMFSSYLFDVEVRELFDCTVPSGAGRDVYGMKLSQSNQLRFIIDQVTHLNSSNAENVDKTDLLELEILFMATELPLSQSLHIIFSSPHSGFVAFSGYGYHYAPKDMDASAILSLPDNQLMLVSFADFRLQGDFSMAGTILYPATDFVTLYSIDSHETETELWRKTGEQHNMPIEVYNTSMRIRYQSESRTSVGIKLKFTFAPLSSKPQVLDSGLHNCSAHLYEALREHVHCNLQVECEGGEDEGGHCPFSSPACAGHVSVGNKCYVLTDNNHPLSWLNARDVCQSKGGQLASVRNDNEVDAFLQVFRLTTSTKDSYVGMFADTDVPNLYRNVYRWLDNTVDYSFQKGGPSVAGHVGVYFTPNDMLLDLVLGSFGDVNYERTSSFVCEYHWIKNTSWHRLSNETAAVQLAILSTNTTITKLETLPDMTVCPRGYLTHLFLACDPLSACHVERFALTCPLSPSSTTVDNHNERVNMFVCDNKGQSLPYTLVCNFDSDCGDGSDEGFCDHSHVVCEERNRCRSSRQCLGNIVTCNRVTDCYDNSDETDTDCLSSAQGYSSFQVKPPARVDFTSEGTYTMSKLNTSHTCPDTHFMCPGRFGYCLPVYVLCNGLYDCPGHEDEMGCDDYTCQGYYRCRGSIICLHVDQLCDGVEQCPRRDDEMLCSPACPHSCRCQGLSYVCREAFPAHSYRQLRYLDAGRSGIGLSHLADNSYLVWLSLASCGMTEVPVVSLLNLQTLDLGDNNIVSMTFDFVLSLQNLRELRLSGNPLASLVVGEHKNRQQTTLVKVDLSETRLPSFDCEALSSFPEVQILNLSNIETTSLTFGTRRFRCQKNLRELDLRGTNTQSDLLDLFHGLQQTEMIFSSNYRHCCPSVLPESSENMFCIAPFTGFSSCEDLLRSNIHRASLWVMAFMSTVGNAVCIFARLLLEEKSSDQSTSHIFTFNLCVANFMMGLYISIVAFTDIRLRGDFLSHETDWLSSLTCTVAGFLALTSTQAAIFFVFLITLDRLLALCWVSKKLCVKSTWMACLISWLLAVVLAAVPLIPELSSWEIYTSTNLCSAVPSLSADVGGHLYSFSVLVMLNLLMALVTGLCQMAVYLRVRADYVMASAKELSRDMVLAKRVTTIVITDVICWMAVGVLGVLSSFAVVGDDVIRAVVVFALPLKPALNPLLYAFSLTSEQQQLGREKRMVSLYESRAKISKAVTPEAKLEKVAPIKQSPIATNKEEVFQFLTQRVRSLAVERADIEQLLDEY